MNVPFGRPHDPLLTVLVPVRNGAPSLGGWLEGVSAFADQVIALDDGSTDDTRQLLESHPIVSLTLANPVRPTYNGWDDLANRQRLVYAALAQGSSWLMFLDADETLDEADGRALRHFVEHEAQPGFAYGFEVFRMVEELANYSPRSLWVFRLFSSIDAVAPLGSQRLHFVPVPSGIERQRWLQTSIRIRHTSGLTSAHREARFAKYLEADPDNEFQADYSTLLAEPDRVLPWRQRDEALPVLLGPAGRYADQHGRQHELEWPAISAVVIAQDDEAVIEQSIVAIDRQRVADDIEIILVCSGADGTFERIRRRYPHVRCVQLPRRALPGEARNAGLWMARGDYISYPGSHIQLLPGSLQARLDAHEDGWDMVTGSVVNGNLSPPGWASYFLDHATKTPARKSGAFTGAPGSASYVTRDLRRVGGFPEDVRAGEDTVVNHRLHFEGKRTYFCAPASFLHISPSRTTTTLLRHHFQRGRALGRIIRARNPGRARTKQLRSTTNLPARRLRTITTAIERADKETRSQFDAVRRQVTVGAWSASMGTWFELAVGSRSTGRHDGPATLRAPTDAPILALGGRCGEAPTGLLSAGIAQQAARRLRTLATYARTVCAVRPALAPIVTSATVTAEVGGTYTIDMTDDVLDGYLRAARSDGAQLLLQLQPGRADLLDLLERWRGWLRQPDVGVLFDVRDIVAFDDQWLQLAHVVPLARDIGGDETIVLVRGTGASDPGAEEPDVLDLRSPGTPFPHEALAASPRPAALVYQ